MDKNPEKEDEYLNTFILGDSSGIEENILNSYRDNGISHLFSVSGMHITHGFVLQTTSSSL